MASKRRLWQRGDRVEDYLLLKDACGVAVVITNDYRQSRGLSNLDGTVADGDKMMEAFEFFRFDCIRAKNLHSEEINEVIKTVSECTALVKCKCIAFVFSGHGGEGVIYGNDKDAQSASVDVMDDIVQPFDPKDAPAIANVPKLFFIDACRGSESVGVGGGKGKSPESRGSRLDTAAGIPVLPGNFIMGNATMTGYKSYLRSDNKEGSVWMPLLAEELQRVPERDVLNVLQRVNERLYNDYVSERIKFGRFQQPHLESTTRNPVNLFLLSGLKESKAIKRPTMPELIHLTTKDGSLRVKKHLVASGYTTCVDFANMLLNDTVDVDTLVGENHENADQLVRAIFDSWLKRDDDNLDDPAFPRSWLALVHCLEATDPSKLGQLVKALRDYCKS